MSTPCEHCKGKGIRALHIKPADPSRKTRRVRCRRCKGLLCGQCFAVIVCGESTFGGHER